MTMYGVVTRNTPHSHTARCFYLGSEAPLRRFRPPPPLRGMAARFGACDLFDHAGVIADAVVDDVFLGDGGRVEAALLGDDLLALEV